MFLLFVFNFLNTIIRVFWIRLKSNLSSTSRTSNIESKDLNTQILFSIHALFASIEFLALVDIFKTGRATHRERGHEPDLVLLILWHFATRDLKKRYDEC